MNRLKSRLRAIIREELESINEARPLARFSDQIYDAVDELEQAIEGYFNEYGEEKDKRDLRDAIVKAVERAIKNA